MAVMKRDRPDDWNISDIEAASTAANVHGIVTELSPIKVSRRDDNIKYFDARITNGRKTLRMVAFDPTLRSQMETAQTNSTPIAIINCQIKEKTEYNFGNNPAFEIHTSKRSKVEASPRKLQLPEDF